MNGSQQQYMVPVTGGEARIRALEMEGKELNRFLKAQEGKPWSSAAVNAGSRLTEIQRLIEGLQGRKVKTHLSGQSDSRIIRDPEGQEYLTPTAPPSALSEGQGPQEVEPWKSPPVKVENVRGGQRLTRFVEVPRRSMSVHARKELDDLAVQAASKGGREPVYMVPRTP